MIIKLAEFLSLATYRAEAGEYFVAHREALPEHCRMALNSITSAEIERDPDGFRRLAIELLDGAFVGRPRE